MCFQVTIIVTQYNKVFSTVVTQRWSCSELIWRIGKLNLTTQWSATHICKGVTALCTIHKIFKLSLRSSHWELCLHLLWIHYCEHWGGHIQHVCFVIIAYMLSTVDLSPEFPQQWRQLQLWVLPPLCLSKSIKRLDGHALHYRDRNGFHIQPNNVHEQ